MSRVLMALVVVGLAAPAWAEAEWRPRLLHAALASAMVAHGADVATSLHQLGRDPQRYREANPLLRPFATRPVAFGVVKMGLAAGVNLGLVHLHRSRPRTALVVTIAQTVLVGAVAVRNARP